MSDQSWRAILNSCNLNHLVVLDALISERHVTNAASRIGMSQPAVSRILKSMRETLNDPILIQGAYGPQLTPRAQEIEPKLKEWLRGAAGIIGTKPTHPEEYDQEIRISSLDDCQILFLDTIRSTLATEAPNLRVRFTSQWGSKYEGLALGTSDLLIDIIPDIKLDTPSQKLIDCDWICIMRGNHPSSTDELTLERYLSLEHALVTTTDTGPALIDQHLPDGHPARNVVLRLPFFAPLPDVITNSDLVTTIPRHLARKLFQDREVVFKNLPFRVQSYAYSLLWHQRSKNDPPIRFAIERITEVCRNQILPIRATSE